jgi:hypothetical protein
MLNHPEPKTGLEEKFSVAFPLAHALIARVLSADRSKGAFDLALELDSAKSVHGLMELDSAKT